MTGNTKEWIQYGSAIFMILTGSILSFISFFTMGTVVSGVLLYLSEALVFSGAIYGVNIYYRSKFGEFESKAEKRIEKRIEYHVDKKLEEVKDKDADQNNS